MLRKSVAVILMVVLFTGFVASGYAQAAAISLEQAKSFARINSRKLSQLKLNIDKAQYQLDQAESNQTNEWIELDQLDAEYSSLETQLSSLDPSDPSNTDKITEVNNQMASLRSKISDQVKAVAASVTIREAEDAYDDSVAEQDIYKEKLDYEVENLYTSILTQQDTLKALQEEASLKEKLQALEEQRCAMGASSQYKVDQLAAELEALKQKAAEAHTSVMQSKGSLNDYMGREYDQDVELEGFTPPEPSEIPDYETLLSKASGNYLTVSQLERDIEQGENNSYSDYYEERIQNLELKNKEIQLEDEEAQLKQTISNLLSDYNTRQESLRIANINYDNALKAYNWDKKRFGLGQIAKTTLLQTELSYIQAQNQKCSAAYALYLAERSLKLAEKGIL
jgi:outer membrane protein TolC